MHKKGSEKTGPSVGTAAAHKEGFMEEQKTKQKKEAEIQYIMELLKSASPEKVHKMFISASTLLGA